MSDNEEPNVNNEAVIEVNEDIQQSNVEQQIIDNEKQYTKSIEKPKKPRTEKQKEALRKAQLKRKENAEKRKLLKEYEKTKKTENNKSRDLMDDSVLSELNKEEIEYLKKLALHRHTSQSKPIDIPQPTPRQRKKKVVYEDSSSSEEEVVYVKKPSRKKQTKKKKKVILPSSSSEEESSEEEKPQVVQHQYTPSYTYNKPTRLKYSDVFRFQ